MSDSHSVTIGSRILVLAKLKLGQLRQNEALRDAVAGLQSMGGTSNKGGGLPTSDQFSTMLLIAHASAQSADPSLTLDDFAMAVDAEDYDTGLALLAQCVTIATTGARNVRLSRASGAPVAGEADSPSSSTSVDSTGSSPLPPGGDTTISMS